MITYPSNQALPSGREAGRSGLRRIATWECLVSRNTLEATKTFTSIRWIVQIWSHFIRLVPLCGKHTLLQLMNIILLWWLVKELRVSVEWTKAPWEENREAKEKWRMKHNHSSLHCKSCVTNWDDGKLHRKSLFTVWVTLFLLIYVLADL